MHWIKRKKRGPDAPSDTRPAREKGAIRTVIDFVTITPVVVIVVSLAVLTVWASLDERIFISDVQVPDELVKQGLTPERLEVVIQQAIEHTFDSEATSLSLPSSPRNGIASAVPRAFAPQSYDRSLVELQDKRLSIKVAGESLPVRLLSRTAAAWLPWARRQSLLAVRIATVGAGMVDIQYTIDRSDKGAVIHRIVGPVSDLIEPQGGTMERIAIEVLQATRPSGAASYLINRDLDECNCIRAATLESIEAHLQDASPVQTSLILFQLASHFAFHPPGDEESVSSRAAFERVQAKASVLWSEGPWKFFDLAARPEISNGYCADFPHRQRAIARSATDRELNEFLVPAGLVVCAAAYGDTQTLREVERRSEVRARTALERQGGFRANTALDDLVLALAPTVRRAVEIKASGKRMNLVELQAMLSELAKNDRSKAFESYMRFFSAYGKGDAEGIAAAAEVELARPFPTDCGLRPDLRCFVDQATRKELLKGEAEALLALDALPQQALKICQGAAALDARDPMVARCLGLAYYRTGDAAQSAHWLESAHRALVRKEINALAPVTRGSREMDAQVVRLQYAMLRAQQGHAQEALQFLEKIRTSDGDYGDSDELVSWIASEHCDAATLERLEAKDLYLPAQRELLAIRMDIAKGKLPSAKAAARSLILRSREDVSPVPGLVNASAGLANPANQRYQGHLLLGLAELAGGNTVAAASAFIRVTELAPINAEARISLAEATAGTAMAPAAMRQNVCQNVRKRYAGRPSMKGF
ncbi:hypothetical protein AB4Z46_14015 [Variovorax sp. M-6]|uniref:hypothetical protein n=1 Tax=Variovorax sp. M-6 TaxID=3233041 RepID=UPI003F9D348F